MAAKTQIFDGKKYVWDRGAWRLESNRSIVLGHSNPNVPARDADRARLIRSNPHAFFAFLIASNLENIHDTLKNNMGYTYLPFKSEKATVVKIVDNLIQKHDTAGLQTLIDNFRFKDGHSMSEEFKHSFING